MRELAPGRIELGQLHRRATLAAGLDIWVHDLKRRTRERLTRDPVGALFPVWTPDSRTLVYASAKGGPFNVFAQSASATGNEQLLYRAPMPFLKYPSAWRPTGAR